MTNGAAIPRIYIHLFWICNEVPFFLQCGLSTLLARQKSDSSLSAACSAWYAFVLTGQRHLPGGDHVQDGEEFHLHETWLVQAGGYQVRGVTCED